MPRIIDLGNSDQTSTIPVVVQKYKAATFMIAPADPGKVPVGMVAEVYLKTSDGVSVFVTELNSAQPIYTTEHVGSYHVRRKPGTTAFAVDALLTSDATYSMA